MSTGDQIEALIAEQGLLHVLTALELACMDRANGALPAVPAKQRARWRAAETALQALARRFEDL